MTDGQVGAERTMWTLFEPLHAVTYFAPLARQAFTDAGLRGYWRGYFAGRAAPLGAVSAAPVVASFFSFAPSMVYRALPQVWELADPDRVLAARVDGAVASLSVLLDGVPEADVLEAATLLERAVAGAEPAGRVLGAANAALPPHERPLARLWQAATTLREHRGDGHNAALVAAGVGPEVLVLRCGMDLTRETMQPGRGWTDDEWAAAGQALVERGLLDPAGRATAAGAEVMRAVEAATDRAAAGPWRGFGGSSLSRLAALLTPMAVACHTALPSDSPIGLPAPSSPAPSNPAPSSLA